MSETKNENRLINEKLPYLQQHAHNPVDWYPWPNEAFEKAKSEDKPIFLSIGYSTCHWWQPRYLNQKNARLLTLHCSFVCTVNL